MQTASLELISLALYLVRKGEIIIGAKYLQKIVVH